MLVVHCQKKIACLLACSLSPIACLLFLCVNISLSDYTLKKFTYILIYTYIHIHINIHTCSVLCEYIHIDVKYIAICFSYWCTFSYNCTYSYLYIHIHIHVYTYTYWYKYVYWYKYTYYIIYLYIYIHMHTYSLKWQLNDDLRKDCEVLTKQKGYVKLSVHRVTAYNRTNTFAEGTVKSRNLHNYVD